MSKNKVESENWFKQLECFKIYININECSLSRELMLWSSLHIKCAWGMRCKTETCFINSEVADEVLVWQCGNGQVTPDAMRKLH